MATGFRKSDVCAAINNNDKAFLDETLSKLGYKNKDSRTIFLGADRSFMTMAFGHAAIAAGKGNLDPEIIGLLIERAYTTVNIYDIVHFYQAVRGLEATEADYDLIPDDVKVALEKNNGDEFDEAIAAAILQMDSNAIDALLSFILKETETINVGYSYSILSNIYTGGLIPDADLMMIMCFSLKDPQGDKMMSGLGELLALGALGSIFS
ncbi:hypothetical protein J5500_00985 [Candidatus Saccharibacteria bacterium]|nr:hypothetical protein [Candidatus Saccharibacteria bacterium]